MIKNKHPLWKLLFISWLICYAGIASALEDNSEANNVNRIVVKPDGKQLWNLHQVSLISVIGEISRVTGKNFIIDSRVTGNVNLLSHRPVNKSQLYQIFLSVLQVAGYSAVPSGSVIKIVPSAVARQLSTPVVDRFNPGHGDELVVRVINVRHIAVQTLVPILRSLVAPQGTMEAFTPSNVLVVADHADNVQRISKIVERIDTSSRNEIEILHLNDANANEVADVINKLLAQNAHDFGTPVNSKIKIAADIRTNSILLSGDKSHRLKIKVLVAQLDIPTPRNGNTEVIYLRNQRSQDLVPVLSTVIKAYYERQKGKLGIESGTGVHSQPQSSYSTNTSSSGSGGYSSINDTDIATIISQMASQTKSESVSGPGIQAEPNTNSLIVTAPPALMRQLKAVIARLDIRRAQVLVEAAILEVTGNNARDLGIEWRTSPMSKIFGAATYSENTISNAANDLAGSLINSYNTSSPSNGLSVGFIRHGNLRSILRVLDQNSNVNIISTPSIVAMDNQPAGIQVATDTPILTGTFITDNSNQNNSVSYKKIGLQLVITPLITKGNSIRLQIYQVVNNIDGTVSVGSNFNNPIVANRSIQTSVVVNDSDVLVLGGLINSQYSISNNKIPILGDIPVIGNLFKRHTSGLIKRNLMIFIRPVIIREQQDSFNVTYDKYNYMRDAIALNSAKRNQPFHLNRDFNSLPAYNDTKPLATLPDPFLQTFNNK